MTKPPSPAEPEENDEPLVDDPHPEADLDEISSFQSFTIFWVGLILKLSAWSKSLQQNPLLDRVARFLQALPVLKEIVFVLHPAMTWQRIADNPRSWFSVFVKYLMPMFLLLAWADGFGLILLGRQQLAEGMTINRFSFPRVVVFELIQWLLNLLLIFICAACVTAFGNACHRRTRMGQSLVLLLHAFGPMLLVQMLNGFPEINVWVTWIIGITLSLCVLYHGVPRIMQPDTPSAMGLFFSSALTLFLLTLVVRLLTYLYIIGYFKPMDRLVSLLATKYF